MKTITINVTQKDIQKSVQKDDGSCCGCPIYHAIHRHKELKMYLVGQNTLYQWNWYGSSNLTIPLPLEAINLSVNSQDHLWDKVKPIKFQVRLP